MLQACKKSNSDAPAPAPIAYYKFDNDYLTNDISSLLTGQLVGNAVSSTDSFNVSFACLSLSGDGYVEVKHSDLIDFGSSQFTLSIWIRPTKISGAYLVTKIADASTDAPYSLDIHPGVVRAFVRTTTAEQFLIQGITPIKPGVWQHIAATLSSTQLTVYYNGKKEGSIKVDRPLAVSKGKLNIGGSETYFPAASFNGRVDNVKIFDRALTDGQVNELYKNYKN